MYMEILNQNPPGHGYDSRFLLQRPRHPFLVFSIEDRNIVRAVCGENVGTVITKGLKLF